MALVTPRGMSITEAYRHYRDGKLLVNRAYQRKLVWTVEEKRKLIDSILHGYPIPLILLAQTKEGYWLCCVIHFRSRVALLRLIVSQYGKF